MNRDMIAPEGRSDIPALVLTNARLIDGTGAPPRPIAALRIAHAILSALKPYAVGQYDQQLDELLVHYR